MEEILASTTEVAEGVETSKALVNLIRTKCKGYRLDLKFPILFGIAQILEGELTPEEGLKGIMNLPFIMENFDERYSPEPTPSPNGSGLGTPLVGTPDEALVGTPDEEVLPN